MKKNNFQNKQINDDELDQISGGGRLWDFFTAEFRGFFWRRKKTRNPMWAREDDDQYGVTTLEMRVRPNNDRNADSSNDVIKL